MVSYVALWIGIVIYGAFILALGVWEWNILFGCGFEQKTGWPCRKDRRGGCECGRGK